MQICLVFSVFGVCSTAAPQVTDAEDHISCLEIKRKSHRSVESRSPVHLQPQLFSIVAIIEHQKGREEGGA